MALNPFALGEQVIDQFHRYLMTYFPIADRRLEDQVREALQIGPSKKAHNSMNLSKNTTSTPPSTAFSGLSPNSTSIRSRPLQPLRTASIP